MTLPAEVVVVLRARKLEDGEEGEVAFWLVVGSCAVRWDDCSSRRDWRRCWRSEARRWRVAR